MLLSHYRVLITLREIFASIAEPDLVDENNERLGIIRNNEDNYPRTARIMHSYYNLLKDFLVKLLIQKKMHTIKI